MTKILRYVNTSKVWRTQEELLAQIEGNEQMSRRGFTDFEVRDQGDCA